MFAIRGWELVLARPAGGSAFRGGERENGGDDDVRLVGDVWMTLRGSEAMGSWKRSSGVLLHPTSLPGPDGVGCLGRFARRWIDRLAEGGQRWWQVLPLNPPGHGGSPYSALSAFAGNPMLIDAEQLVEAEWLSGADLNVYRRLCAAGSSERFDVEVIREAKGELLKRAFEGWKEAGGASESAF